ncbi:MAG: FtsQ-type POTRA domain-containing protein [Opitutae bacterium]|nr:FtsQ-type POTRA domain-containing protein [Opitutae bacterium]
MRKTEERRQNRPRESVLKVAARSVERRRTVRRRIGGALALLAGGPALAAGLIWGGHAAWRAMFAENEFFEIRQIEVTTDGDLGAENILEYARVRKGLNLFAVRPEDIRGSLLSVPVIANAQVGRRLPDTLVIEVAERVSVARLGRPGAGSPLAVDATGHVLGPSSVRATLPVVLGVRDHGLRPGDVVNDPMLRDALKILEICNQAAMRQELAVATIDLGSEEQIEVGLMSGEQVLLSRGQLEEKLRQLPIMRSVARSRGLDLAVYDMTVDRNYVGRPATWVDPAEGTGE